MTLVWADRKTRVQIKCTCGTKGYKWKPEDEVGGFYIRMWQREHTCS